jgi:hypothetical protein
MSGCLREPPIPLELQCEVGDFPSISADETDSQNESSQISAAHIYVDGTPSMEGYAIAEEGIYAATLEALLDKLSLNSEEMNFYRLGTEATAIRQEQYLQAKVSNFYSGNATFPPLPVVKLEQGAQIPQSSEDLTVIITDLFQSQEDIARLLKLLGQFYLNAEHPQQAVGIVGIKSEFNGRVYKEGIQDRGFFEYSTGQDAQKPFYLVLLGQYGTIAKQIDYLSETVGAKTDLEATIFSPTYFYRSPLTQRILNNAELTSSTESRSISVPPLKMKAQGIDFEKSDFQLFQFFEIEKAPDDPSIVISDTVSFDPYPHTPSLNPQSFQIEVIPFEYNQDERTYQASNSGSLRDALVLQGWSFGGQSTQQRLQFDHVVEPKNLNRSRIDLFQVDILLNPESEKILLYRDDPRFVWWTEWDVNESEAAPWKTPNLYRFLQNLVLKSEEELRQNPLVLGRFCYAIKKQ